MLHPDESDIALIEKKEREWESTGLKTIPKVYSAINRVQAALCKEGITKDRKNVTQGFMFRGIDDVYNALSPLLAQNGLCILPRFIKREVTEKITQKGGTLFYVTVEAEFDFVSSEDSSKHTVRTFGEAMDSGDKATNKAMSAAYKYAAFQTFAIPTEGDNDADASTPPAVLPNLEALKVCINNIKEWKDWNPFVQDQRTRALKEGLKPSEVAIYQTWAEKKGKQLKAAYNEKLLSEINSIDNVKHLENWQAKHQAELNDTLKARVSERMSELKKAYQDKIEPAREPGSEG